MGCLHRDEVSRIQGLLTVPATWLRGMVVAGQLTVKLWKVPAASIGAVNMELHLCGLDIEPYYSGH